MVTEADVAIVRHVVQRVLVPCVFVIGLLGNSVSIYVLTRKRMRCTTNIYLTALAITDIIYLTMALLLSLKHYDYVERHFEAYWQGYGIVVWICDACAYSSIYIAVCFTIERFIAICYPLKRQTFCTESLAKKVITGVALFCLLSTVLTAFEHQYRTASKLIDSHGRPCNLTLANVSTLPTTKTTTTRTTTTTTPIPPSIQTRGATTAMRMSTAKSSLFDFNGPSSTAAPSVLLLPPTPALLPPAWRQDVQPNEGLSSDQEEGSGAGDSVGAGRGVGNDDTPFEMSDAADVGPDPAWWPELLVQKNSRALIDASRRTLQRLQRLTHPNGSTGAAAAAAAATASAATVTTGVEASTVANVANIPDITTEMLRLPSTDADVESFSGNDELNIDDTTRITATTSITADATSSEQHTQQQIFASYMRRDELQQIDDVAVAASTLPADAIMSQEARLHAYGRAGGDGRMQMPMPTMAAHAATTIASDALERAGGVTGAISGTSSSLLLLLPAMENDVFAFDITEYCQNVTYYKNSLSSLAQNALYTRIWYFFTLFVFVLIPLCLLGTFNCFLIMLVRRSRNLRGELTNASSMRRTNRRPHVRSSVSQENRVTVTLIAVVLLFIVCQLPWAIYLIVSEHMDIEQNLQAIIGNIFNFLAAIHAAANFFLYCVLSDKYRKTVRELITGYKYRTQLTMRSTLRTNTSLYHTHTSTTTTTNNNNNNNSTVLSTVTPPNGSHQRRHPRSTQQHFNGD